jgi:hypothetical protein
MSCAQVADIARDKHPGMRILFANGHAETSAPENALDRNAHILRQRFRLEGLRAAIARAVR